jgi:hypothetical protein
MRSSMNCTRLVGIALALCFIVHAGKRGLRQRQGEGESDTDQPPIPEPAPSASSRSLRHRVGECEAPKTDPKKPTGELADYLRQEWASGKLKTPKYNKSQ